VQLIDRLQKLIAHERSSRDIGNTAEAEAFAVKIQTMLTQHKLTMSDVEFEAQDATDPIGHDEVCLEGRSTPTWQVYLAQSIARNFFCCAFGVSRENRHLFIGRDSDRLAAVEMFRYLVGLGSSLAAKEAQAYMNSPRIQAKVLEYRGTVPKADIAKVLRKVDRDFTTSFLVGFSAAIYNRLDSTRKDLEATASTHATGLILRDQAAIQAFVQTRYETKIQSRKPVTANNSGLASGLAHGSAVSLKSRTALGAGA
jgi:hypothetical protein